MAHVVVVAGLGYGDEGKGTTVDHLVRQHRAKVVVRYNGGAQAAHNVVLKDGRHHTFAQFGSGTFAGARTHLSRFMFVNPYALFAEAKHLIDLGVPKLLGGLTVERGSTVTTPFHIAANRIREMGRTNRHGSCGMGIGETTRHSLDHADDVLHVGDFEDIDRLRNKLTKIRDCMASNVAEIARTMTSNDAIQREWELLTSRTLPQDVYDRYRTFSGEIELVGPEWLDEQLAGSGTIIFEGAQGILLDQDYGFQPHTTWTDTTFQNALSLIDAERFRAGKVEKLGVLRAYATRHGAGPFVTEEEGFRPLSTHDHNGYGEWQQTFRSGAFDAVSANYAIQVAGGVDGVAITNLDRVPIYGKTVPVCIGYESEQPYDKEFFEGPTPKFINRIRVRRAEKPHCDVQYKRQEQLTEALRKVSPIYDTFTFGTPTEYAGFLKVVLGNVSLKLLSFGTKHEDKISL